MSPTPEAGAPAGRAADRGRLPHEPTGAGSALHDVDLGELLHRGSQTTVRRARHRRTGRRLVVKQAIGSPPRTGRHGSEPLDAVDHPGVLVPLDRDGAGNVVLPEITGGTLAELIAARRPLPPAAVAQLVLGIADGLDHLHRRGLVHGDLSASNVLLHPDGQPVLADAQPAPLPAPAPPPADVRDERVATPARTTGTAGYAPLEVVEGVAPGPSADLFALGVLGLECLGPAGAPELRAVLSEAAHPDPARRPPTARALAEAVVGAVPRSSWLDRAAPVDPPDRTALLTRTPATRAFGPPPPTRAPAPSGAATPRRTGRSVAALLAVLLAFGVVVVAVQQGGTPTCPPPPAADEQPPDAVLGDLDGDGCDELVRFDADAAVAALPDERRLQVGEPGDALLLGDWDCDGADTPALYRPSTGEVFEFGSWLSGDGTLTSEETHETGIRDGTPKVAEPTGAGCDRVAVTPAAG